MKSIYESNENHSDKLFLYIIISVLIHLIIVQFIPFGYFIDAAADTEDTVEDDFEYVQYVELRSYPEEKPEVIVEEPEEDPVEKEEQTENKEEEIIEEPEEPEPEPEPEPEEPEPEEEIVEEEPIDEPEPEEVEEPDDNESAQDEDQTTQEESKEEILTAEDSETEVQEEKEEDKPQQEEKSETEDKDTSAEKSEQEKEEPAPPPSAGELISRMEDPSYPKDESAFGETGSVLILLKIDSGGNLINEPEILKSSGIDSMDMAATYKIENEWSFYSYDRGYELEIEVNYLDPVKEEIAVEPVNVHFN